VTLWPRGLGWRLTIAIAFSVTVIGVLSVVVERMDTKPKPTKRARSAILPLDGAEASAVHAVGASFRGRRASGSAAAMVLSQVSPSAPATLTRALGFRLRATEGTIMLTHRESALAPDIAPVVEILSTGEVVLRRPMRIAAGPGQAPPISGQGHGAGVILPVANLDLLSPAARAALIGLLQLWLTERPVLPARLAFSDLLMAPGALLRLLSWVP